MSIGRMTPKNLQRIPAFSAHIDTWVSSRDDTLRVPHIFLQTVKDELVRQEQRGKEGGKIDVSRRREQKRDG
jgi:hypothetical protein